MFVSNVFFGQGPWTPWQMLSMGLVGYLAGVMGNHRRLVRRWSVAAFALSWPRMFGRLKERYQIG